MKTFTKEQLLKHVRSNIDHLKDLQQRVNNKKGSEDVQ